MAKKQLSEISIVACAMFPDEAERTTLLQSALRRLHPDAPKGDRLNKPIDIAALLIEMQRIKRMRELVQLVWAIRPANMAGATALIGDSQKGSEVETAYLFGVSESTVANDWIPNGMPVQQFEE